MQIFFKILSAGRLSFSGTIFCHSFRKSLWRASSWSIICPWRLWNDIKIKFLVLKQNHSLKTTKQQIKNQKKLHRRVKLRTHFKTNVPTLTAYLTSGAASTHILATAARKRSVRVFPAVRMWSAPRCSASWSRCWAVLPLTAAQP